MKGRKCPLHIPQITSLWIIIANRLAQVAFNIPPPIFFFFFLHSRVLLGKKASAIRRVAKYTFLGECSYCINL